MSSPRLLLLSSLLLVGGCLWPVREKTDRVVRDLAGHPFDVSPVESPDGKLDRSARSSEQSEEQGVRSKEKKAISSLLTPPSSLADKSATDVQTVAFMQADRTPEKRPKYDLKIPPDIPGSEAPLIDLDPKKYTPEQIRQKIRDLYPELPPLPIAPAALPGPNGRPYTLADLQKLAAENSPTLRQAVSDVRAAVGALVQAKTYPNPTVGYAGQPTNNNSTTGAQGAFVEQKIITFGKQKMQVAAAQKDLDNAELALRRARSDLATNVRNAYFGLIVAQETVRVNRALARFTDEIYRLYTGMVSGTIAASYEPAGLRAQVHSTRLAYKQAIQSYIYAWKQLVATIGLTDLPLTEVAGRVDRFIPYYDYDAVRAHVLSRHTDVLTARNGVDKAHYNLKRAQITPYPDMDVQAYVFKETTLVPFSIFYTVQVGFPLPIWDQNKGNIMSAQAALIRAIEESHRVENALTNNLAANYANYQNNLRALEEYRRYILPDQVRYYRGVFRRRQADITANPGDLVAAQQTLAANVQTYLGILGSLWSSVVSVADLVQTDDLFQLAKPRELPELPVLEDLPRWLCPHNRLAAPSAGAPGNGCPPGVPAGQPTRTPPTPSIGTPPLPAPRRLEDPEAKKGGATPPGLLTLPDERTDPGGLPPRREGARPQAISPALTEQLLEPPPEIHKQPSVSGTVGGR